MHPRHLRIVDEYFMLSLKTQPNEWPDEIEPVGEYKVCISKNGGCSLYGEHIQAELLVSLPHGNEKQEAG